MLGLPGAGKGTQAAHISAEFGVPHISTGEMFRRAVQSNSDLGQQAAEYLNRGDLVPDELTLGIVRERMAEPDCRRGFVLDGFPRTVAQAEALDRLLAEMGTELDAAVLVEVSQAEAVRRIAQRRVCSQCALVVGPAPVGLPEGGKGTGAAARPERCPRCGGTLVQRQDDEEETARQRVAVYMAKTKPVIEFYQLTGRLMTVNGEQPVGRVWAELLAGLKRRLVGRSRRLPADPPGGRAAAEPGR